MRTIILLTVFTMLSTYAKAQLMGAPQKITSEKSYFISFDSDTIYGEVQYVKRLIGNKMNKVRFYDAEGYEYVLRAKESKGFCMNGVHYQSKLIDEFHYFLREAVSGGPSLFVVEKNYQKKERNSLDMLRADRKEARVLQQFIETRGKMYKVYPKRFKKQAPQLFSSYPDVVKMILSDELGIHDIEEIVLVCNYSNEGLSLNKE